MGSLCSNDEENQSVVESLPKELPIVIWGDIVNSETRTVMSLLTLAKVRFEFQHVSTPVEVIHEESDLQMSGN